MKAITQKFKNKRVTLAYSENTDTFILQFIRLKDKDEFVEETPPLATCKCEVIRGKIIKTTILLTREAMTGLLVILQSKYFNEFYFNKLT